MFKEYSITYSSQYASDIVPPLVGGQKYDFITDEANFPCDGPVIIDSAFYTYSSGTRYDLMTSPPISLDLFGWI